MLTGAILALVVVGGVAGALVWMRSLEAARLDGFQALAATRGWSLTIGTPALGRPATLRLASRSGPGWQAEVRRAPGPGRPIKPRTASTEFRSPEPSWQAGQLLVRVLNDGDKGDGGVVPDDGKPVVTLHTSVPADGALDLDGVRRHVERWAASAPGSDGLVTIRLDGDGLRVQMAHDLATAERMEAFVEFCQGLVSAVDQD